MQERKEMEVEPQIRFTHRGDTFLYSEETYNSVSSAHGRDSIRILARHAYSAAVKHAHPTQLEEPLNDHVEILVISKQGPRFIYVRSAIFPVGILSIADCKHLFIFEHVFKDREFRICGGINGKDFFDKAKFVSRNSVVNGETISPETEHWILDRAHLAQKKFFDAKVMEKWESRRELLKYRKEDPMNLLLCGQTEESEYSLEEVQEWMRRRVELLKCVGIESKSKVSDSTKSRNYEFILEDKLYCSIARERRRSLDHTSHMALCAYALLVSDAESTKLDSVKQWFSDREELIFRFRVEVEYPGEQDVMKLIEFNDLDLKPIKGMDESLKKECEGLFIRCYPRHPLPVHWFAVSIFECPDVIPTSDAIMERGVCYLAYRQIQRYYMPRVFVKSLMDRISSKEKREKMIESLMEDRSDQRWDLVHTGKEIISQIYNLTSVGNYRVPSHVLDIEEAFGQSLMAPCHYWLYHRMVKGKYLHFNERFDWGSMMLDCGFKSERIVKMGVKHCKPDKFMDRRSMEEKYKSSVKRKYAPPMGGNCKTLQAKTCKPEDENCSGCPFTFLDSERLHELLGAMGISDEKKIEEIDEIRRQQDEESSTHACASVFAAIHGLPVIAMNRHHRPEVYFGNALRNRTAKENIGGAERLRQELEHLLDIEYTQ